MKSVNHKLTDKEVEIIEREIKSTQSIFSDEQKEVLLLYFFEKINLTQISRKINLPLQLVKNRLTKGLFILKKIMNEKEYVKAFSILYKETE